MNSHARPGGTLGALVLVASVIIFTRAEGQSSSYTNVRVVNPVVVVSDGGLGVVGMVGLTTQAIADLTAPQCAVNGEIFPLEKMHLDVDGGPHPIPPFLPDGGFGGDPNRSSITIVNTDTKIVRTMACDLLALDGGLPSCDTGSGYAETLENKDRFTWNVGQSRVIYCLPCNDAGVDMGYREENCRGLQ